LFLDPKLLNKSGVRFVLWWNSLNKFFISPFWVGICMRDTLKTQSFGILSKMQKCWTKVPSILLYDEIRWTKLNKKVILPYFTYNLKMKFILEVLFKKFHPRINLKTLFLTKSYLLNMIKPFLDKISKFFARGVPLGTWTY
jgi:hypothetical protein